VKALILGSSGQVAHALKASAIYDQAIALGRPDIDLTDAESVRAAIAAHRPDVVINAAAYTAVDKAESDAEAAFALNRDGPAAAAKAAYEIGAAFIHLSTDFVFDGTKEAAWLEDDVTNPLGVYGQSKLEGELAVSAAHLNAVTVRLSWVYGAHGANFAKTMLRLAADREEIGVVDDQRGRPTAAEDIAPALWKLARGLAAMGESPHQLYHLGPQGDASWADFAVAIMDASGKAGGPSAAIRRITTTDYPTPAKRPANSVLDCTRIAQDWDIALPHWEESCQRVVTEIVAGLKIG
jgi:dTDP-4-dehydrorhamnose reductase